MKEYKAPQLFVDEFAADTMIASSETKNGNPDNNQNCWGCNLAAGATDQNNTQNSCAIDPTNNPAAYATLC